MKFSPRHSPCPLSSLDVHLLGVVDFDAALFLQERFLYEMGDADEPRGTLLLCEHPPLITIGREGSRSDLLLDPDELLRQGIPIRWVNRGGGVVLHRPGQLAIYSVLPLARLGLGLRTYRALLESVIIQACHDLKIPAQQDDVRPGVWGRAGQLAEIGIAVKRWGSLHGAFVNVSAHPQARGFIQAASGDRFTSLSAQQTLPAPMPTFREAIVRHFAEALRAEETHIFTGSPFLRRTRRVVPLFADSDESSE